MSIETRTLYQSSNGDRWQLARETETGRVFVQHRANEPSGGRVTDMEIGTFLGTGARGPEHQELLRLIGTLVEESAPRGKGMPDEIDGHLVATDMALKIMAHLLHRRGALDLGELAEELEARAKLLGGMDAQSDIAPAATRAAGVLSELARTLRDPVIGLSSPDS